jgi:hypothetical protein
MQGSLVLLVCFVSMGFRDHLPLGEIANHHGTFNQSVRDEMTCFVQTVALFIALALRDSSVHL